MENKEEPKIPKITFSSKISLKFRKLCSYIVKNRKLIIAGTLLPVLVLTFYVLQYRQDLRQRASELPAGDLARLVFNPSGIQTDIGKVVNMSVLAYDTNNNPIWTGVTYEWGISSTGSIGTLSQVTGAIATFIPINNGHGDIFVTARSGSQTINNSIPANVGPIIPTSTPTPSPTQTPSNTPSPTKKMSPTPTQKLSPTPTPRIVNGTVKVSTQPSLKATIIIIRQSDNHIVLSGTTSINNKSIAAGKYYVKFSYNGGRKYKTPPLTSFTINPNRRTDITGNFNTGKTSISYK